MVFISFDLGQNRNYLFDYLLKFRVVDLNK